MPAVKIFVLGKPGSGKSTFEKQLKEEVAKQGKKMFRTGDYPILYRMYAEEIKKGLERQERQGPERIELVNPSNLGGGFKILKLSMLDNEEIVAGLKAVEELEPGKPEAGYRITKLSETDKKTLFMALKRFKASNSERPEIGFDVVGDNKQVTATLNMAMEELRKLVAIQENNVDIITIELARDEYESTFKEFPPLYYRLTSNHDPFEYLVRKGSPLPDGSYILFIESDLDKCKDRIHKRVEDQLSKAKTDASNANFVDNHLISNAVMDAYYGQNNMSHMKDPKGFRQSVDPIIPSNRVYVLDNNGTSSEFRNNLEPFVKKLAEGPIALFTIGPQGIGKTRWVENYLSTMPHTYTWTESPVLMHPSHCPLVIEPARDFEVISFDDVARKYAEKHKITFYDAYHILGTPDSGSTARKKLDAHLEYCAYENMNFISDATNMTRDRREEKAKHLDSKWIKVAVNFMFDPQRLDETRGLFDVENPSHRQILQKRLQERARQTGVYIPPGDVAERITSFEPPTLEEGWDIIFDIDIEGKCVGARSLSSKGRRIIDEINPQCFTPARDTHIGLPSSTLTNATYSPVAIIERQK